MSDCKCQQPCNPCKNNCPDDGEILNVEIISGDDIIPSSVIDPEDCNTNCCGKKCNDNCGVNIQSTNDCLRVDTSECGVVKITSHCPPIVTAGDNVTVQVEDCGQENCSLNYIVSADCKDEKVKACPGDAHPGTLSEKIEAGDGIEITTSDCAGGNGHLIISVDPSVYDDENNKVAVSANCGAKYLEDALQVASDYIKMEKNGCSLKITDKTPKAVYAKTYLTADYVGTPLYNGTTTLVKSPFSGEDEPIDFMLNSTWTTDFISGEIAVMNPRGWIVIKRTGLYVVGFSGSIELSYGVHALRGMLYRAVNTGSGWDYYTVVESRYSGALGQRPCDLPNYATQGASNPDRRFVTAVSVSGGGESGPATASVTKSTFGSQYKIDGPLFSKKTESEGQSGDGYSASLGAYLDRVPINGSTILELNKGDILFLGLKISAEVTHGQPGNNNDGDIFHTADQDTQYNMGHYAVLGRKGGSDARIGGEVGASLYASLIQPIIVQ